MMPRNGAHADTTEPREWSEANRCRAVGAKITDNHDRGHVASGLLRLAMVAMVTVSCSVLASACVGVSA
eukprot:9093608-Lingulodinium_polyedra.AAC.1